jgi:hypothetical protein
VGFSRRINKIASKPFLEATQIIALQITPVMDIGPTTSMTLTQLTEFFSQTLLLSLTSF